MRLALALTTVLAATSAAADHVRAVDDHILPRYAAFAVQAAALDDAAREDCTPDAVRSAYHAAYDAWIGVSHIQFGPAEARNAPLAMAFWPDPKDNVGKAVARLSAAQDPAVDSAEAFAEVSVAAQGFPALERLLTDPQPDADYACAFVRAVARHIAGTSEALSDTWQNGFAATMRDGDGTAFQGPQDAQRALFTSMLTALEFLHDQRLGRPLGTFDRPRPLRAEARRTERSQRHIVLSLQALQELVQTAFPDRMTDTVTRAFDTALARAVELDDPALAGVADPAQRFKVEVLQRAVRDLQVAVADEIGAPLGITVGFNSLDGD